MMLSEKTTTSGTEPRTGKPPAARRCLFGGVDRAELDALLQREMSQLRRVSTERWDFDVTRELPVGAGGRYCWEAVGAEYVPAVYVRPYTYKAVRSKGPAAAAATPCRGKRRLRLEEDAENVRPLPAAPGGCSPAPAAQQPAAQQPYITAYFSQRKRQRTEKPARV